MAAFGANTRGKDSNAPARGTRTCRVFHPCFRRLSHNYEPGDHLFVVQTSSTCNHEVLHARYCRHGLRRRPGLCPRGQPLDPRPCHAGTSSSSSSPRATRRFPSDGLIDCSLQKEFLRRRSVGHRILRFFFLMCIIASSCDALSLHNTWPRRKTNRKIFNWLPAIQLQT